MDERRFDAWTRRRFGFGLAASGVAASLAGMAVGSDAAAAKRKRKRKTCKQNEQLCGKKKCVKGDCCPGKPCGENCECRRTINGKTFCIPTGGTVECAQCHSDADCAAPSRCVIFDCGGDSAVCFVPCGFGS